MPQQHGEGEGEAEGEGEEQPDIIDPDKDNQDKKNEEKYNYFIPDSDMQYYQSLLNQIENQ